MTLNVSVYKVQKGSVSTNDLSDKSINQAIDKAKNISKNTQADDCQACLKRIHNKKMGVDIFSKRIRY